MSIPKFWSDFFHFFFDLLPLLLVTYLLIPKKRQLLARSLFSYRFIYPNPLHYEFVRPSSLYHELFCSSLLPPQTCLPKLTSTSQLVFRGSVRFQFKIFWIDKKFLCVCVCRKCIIQKTWFRTGKRVKCAFCMRTTPHTLAYSKLKFQIRRMRGQKKHDSQHNRKYIPRIFVFGTNVRCRKLPSHAMFTFYYNEHEKRTHTHNKKV